MTEVVTSGRLWTAHNHRHHPRPGDVPYVWGPIGPTNIVGSEPATAPDPVDVDHFEFWSASGTTDGGTVYPVGQRMLSDPGAPAFPSDGTTPGTVTAWYFGPGGENGRPGLIFDAFSEASGDWLDWDGDTIQPFTVTPTSARGAGDDDDEAFTDGANAPVSVTAADPFPGNPLLVFDHWLAIGDGTLPGASTNEITQQPNTSGFAFAIYRAVTPQSPPGPPQFVPQPWRMGDPALVIRTLLAQQSELTRTSTLFDAIVTLTDGATRIAVGEALLGSIVSMAQAQMEDLKRE
jgi:hypothetical protein